MSNYTKIGKVEGARTELHDLLGLTGAEISVNTLQAGTCVPFVHAHKANEEIYFILSGRGKAVIDDEEVDLYFMNAKAPLFIKDEEQSYIYLILPVNFNAAV